MMNETSIEVANVNAEDSGEVTNTNWYLLKFNHISLKKIKEVLQTTEIEHFLPSFVSIENGPRGQKIRRERPLMFNMLFVHCSLKNAVYFVSHHREVNFVSKRIDRSEKPTVALNKYLNRENESGEERMVPKYDDATFRHVVTIPDNQMQMFIKAVTLNKSKSIPYVKPTEIDLEKGDRVRIVGGDYDGIEGILESQKGKDGGIIFVHIQDFIATKTTEIRPEYIQILEFAKSGKHMYKKFDSFMVRGERCVNSLLRGEGITSRDREYFKLFTMRFEHLVTPTTNMKAKLLLYMFIAHSCMGNENESKFFAEELMSFLPNVNSESMRCKCLTYLYACTSDKKYAVAFREYFQELGYVPGKDAKRDELKKVFSDVQWYVETI